MGKDAKTSTNDAEVEIDLVELVKEVLRRWIWIVVAIIIAAPCGKVSGRTVNKAKKQLSLSDTGILGAVVTGVDLKKGRYRRAYREYVE